MLLFWFLKYDCVCLIYNFEKKGLNIIILGFFWYCSFIEREGCDNFVF